MHDAWVVIAYSLPPEPSRLRVAAWRRMKSAGAVHVNEGFWFLPRTPATAQLFQEVAREVRAQGGTAWTFTADTGSHELAALEARFNEARSADFREVVRHCERFLAHIERETNNGNFEFEVVAELEQDVEKRARMLRQAHERDLLACGGGDEADQRLQQCRDALERFTEETYRKTGDA
jgi:hypothetical protein